MNFLKLTVTYLIFILTIPTLVLTVIEQGPHLFDLNEPASSGDNHSSRLRPNIHEERSRKSNSVPSYSSDESVNDQQIRSKRRQRSHSVESINSNTKKPKISVPVNQEKETARRSQRKNKTDMNFAFLEESSSEQSEWDASNQYRLKPRKGEGDKKKKLIPKPGDIGSNDCRIHRPGCDHWEKLSRNKRESENKRWKRLNLTPEQKRIENEKKKDRYARSEATREKRKEWSQRRWKRMTREEKKFELKRKAASMRRLRAKRKKIVT